MTGPAIDAAHSGTRREELRLVSLPRRTMSGRGDVEAMERFTSRLKRTAPNADFLEGLLGRGHPHLAAIR